VSAGVDTTIIAAFAVGFVSFISPCVLPLVPGYLSAVSGVSVAELQRGERGLLRVLAPAIVFCLSFTAVFVALGMTATGLGSALQDSRGTLDKVAGAVIIALGLLFLLTPFVPRLNREWRPDALIARAGSGGPLIAGAAFAFMVLRTLSIAYGQSVWQQLVRPDRQGRVFAGRQAIFTFVGLLTYAALGPLADKVFEPLLLPTGAWASTLGAIVGVGAGRGLSVLVLLIGLGMVLMGLASLASPRLGQLNQASGARAAPATEPVPGIDAPPPG